MSAVQWKQNASKQRRGHPYDNEHPDEMERAIKKPGFPTGHITKYDPFGRSKRVTWKDPISISR